MSASEIELTFIRCSSCKSLMPSTASRCGMCGMDLMNSVPSVPASSITKTNVSKVSESQQPQKQFPKDEVTQQFTRPSSNVENYKNEINTDDSEGFEEHQDFENHSKSDTGTDYRLHNRISEVSGNARQEKKSAVLSFAKEMKVLNQKASRTDLAEEKTSNKLTNTEELKNSFLDQFDESEDDFLDNDLNEEFILGEESKHPSDSISRREESARNHQESSYQDSNYQEPRPLKKKKRKRKKKRVLPLEEALRSDDIISREETRKTDMPVVESRSNHEDLKISDTRGVESRPIEQRPRPATGFRLDRNNEDNNRPEYTSLETRSEITPKVEVPKEETIATERTESRESERRATSDHIRENLRDREPSKVMSNKLIGWFVSYGIELTGKAFEIREGRKFIGRQQLRSFDLVIPDSAVSTPHCLLQVDEHGVHLQDLMSDQGTFIKKTGEREFRKIESSVVLKHGDVLKLGSFELVVCLIPE